MTGSVVGGRAKSRSKSKGKKSKSRSKSRSKATKKSSHKYSTSKLAAMTAKQLRAAARKAGVRVTKKNGAGYRKESSLRAALRKVKRSAHKKSGHKRSGHKRSAHRK